MNVEQDNDRLAVQVEEMPSRFLPGMFIVFVCALIFTFWAYRYVDRTVGFFVGFLIWLFVILFAIRLVMLPTLYTLDRATGELTVLHRTRFFTWKKIYRQWQIKGFRLVTIVRDTGDYRRYRVDLIFSNHIQKEKRLTIPGDWVSFGSDEQAKAETVAAFLGLPVAQTKERLPDREWDYD